LTKQHKILLDLLETSGGSLHRLLTRLTLREDVAEELMQELFIKLSGNEKLTTVENPSAYAFRTAINLAFDWRRKAKPVVDIDNVSEPQSSASTPLDKLIHDEHLNYVLDSIEELPTEARQVLVMRSIEQASYDDIAVHTGKTVHHVRSILNRARTKLKEIVKTRISNTPGKETL
jgi:RNA polymerase sigma-70 factor (ECF subfamily)